MDPHNESLPAPEDSKSLTDWPEEKIIAHLRAGNVQHGYDSYVRELDRRSQDRLARVNLELSEKMTTYTRMAMVSSAVSAVVAMIAILIALLK